MSLNIRSKINFLIHNHTVRNGSIFVFFSFLNSGIGFILLIILANYIDPEGYGHLNLFNTTVMLVGYFICLSTTSYFSVSFFQKAKQYVKEVVNVIVWCTILISALLNILFIILGNTISNLLGLPLLFIVYAIVVCACNIFYTLLMELMRIQEKPIKYGIFSVINVGLNFIITLILIVGFKYGWEGRAYSQLFVSVLMCVMGIIVLCKNGYLNLKIPSKQIIRDTLLYSLPIIPHLFAGWLRSGFDRFVINYYHDATSVGCFGFASSLASIISVAGSAFNATNSVYIYKKLALGYDQNCRNSLNRQNRLMILFFAVLTICVIIGTIIGIPIFFPKYQGSVIYILPASLSSFFWCIYLVYVNYLFYYKKTINLMYVTFSVSILQATLSIIFTKYSVLITAYISMFISLITAFIIYILQKRILQKNYITSES